MTRQERDEHRRAVLQEFRDSGMTQKAFCESRGVALSTLQYWLGRERRRCRGSGSPDVVAVGTVDTVASSGLLRIVGADGVVIEVHRPVSESELTMILRAVSAS